jgi:tetratricopeptide (TPR) repeat protein
MPEPEVRRAEELPAPAVEELQRAETDDEPVELIGEPLPPQTVTQPVEQEQASDDFEEPEHQVPEPYAAGRWKIFAYVAAAGAGGAAIVLAIALVWSALEIRPLPPQPAKVVQGTVKPVEAPPAAAGLIANAEFAAAAQAPFKQGVGLLAQSDFTRAIQAFDDSIRLDPNQPAAYGYRAFAHWNKGAADLAARDYSDAIRLDPRNMLFRLNRAIALNKLGKHSEAVSDLNEVLLVEPENQAALNSRCWARALLDALEEALADCNQAVRLSPKDANALDSRGFVHLKSGRLVRAVADYSSALRIDPKLATSLYGRGLAKIGRGDRGGGTEDVAAAKALRPDIQAEFARYGIR